LLLLLPQRSFQPSAKNVVDRWQLAIGNCRHKIRQFHSAQFAVAAGQSSAANPSHICGGGGSFPHYPRVYAHLV